MRFMILIKSDSKTEAGLLPDEQALSAIGRYNEALVRAGALIAAEGLQPSSRGTRVQLANGKLTRIDGPFAAANELVAGYWFIRASSKAEALEWAKRVPFEEGEVEVRPMFEPEDFAVDAGEQPGATPPRQPGTQRYALLLKADRATERGELPNEKLASEMGALMEELVQSGAVLAGEGLKPTEFGSRVRFSGKLRRVIDGPFSETKEVVAGYALVQFPSKQAAVEVAARMLRIHVENTGVEAGECEVRQLYELSDFPVDPAEKPDGWRTRTEHFRGGSAA